MVITQYSRKVALAAAPLPCVRRVDRL